MSLDSIISDVNKKYKTSIINKGVVYTQVPRIPFSSPRLNYMMYGGLPVGRIIEFAGEEGGGKTTTALDVVKNAQKLFPDKKAVYVDVERTFDPEWATKLGVDVASLVLVTPEEQTAEQIFEITKDIVSTGEVSVCVLDSLGAMVSAQAYSKTIEDRTYGGISMALTLFSKELIPICARTGCMLIGINQVRDDMNSTYGGTTTTGGRAWRHNCSVRMTFIKSDYIDEKGASVSRGVENPAGNFVKVALVKSKVCKLDRKIGFYTLRYLDGIDYVTDIIDLAVKYNLINAAGAWYTLIDAETGEVFQQDGKDLKFQGKAKVREFLIQNPEWFEELSEQLSTHFS